MKLGEYSENILGEQDTAIAFHLDVLTSPDRAAIVQENLHFISNRTMGHFSAHAGDRQDVFNASKQLNRRCTHSGSELVLISVRLESRELPPR